MLSDLQAVEALIAKASTAEDVFGPLADKLEPEHTT